MGKTVVDQVLKFWESGRCLAMRTKSMPRINPAELGWCAPNGEIIFQSNKAAMKFAKNQAVGALKVKNPYEKAVVVRDNVIKGIYKGNESSVSIPTDFPWRHCTVVHGHPEATPISAQDAITLIKDSKMYDEIVAYNVLGEHSTLHLLRKKTSSASLNNTSKSFLDKVNNVKFPSEKASFMNTGMKFSQNVKKPQADIAKIQGEQSKWIDILGSRTRLESDFEKFILSTDDFARYKDALAKGKYSLADQILLNAQSTPAGYRRIHEFWVQNAAKYGLEYKTNYSNLS